MSAGFHAKDRAVLSIQGADVATFIQNLITNDFEKLGLGSVVYSALLSPRGKYLFDFFLVPDGEGILIDIKHDRAEAFAQRMAMYRLRADVQIEPSDLAVVLGAGTKPDDALDDARHPELGWRLYTSDPAAALSSLGAMEPAEYHARRVALNIPETGIELLPDDSYILEMGFERLNGVDFRKGCYVGQEIMARMKHKTDLKKQLVAVSVEGEAPPPGSEIQSDGRLAGTLYSTVNGRGLAHMRLDRVSGNMQAGEARITLIEE